MICFPKFNSPSGVARKLAMISGRKSMFTNLAHRLPKRNIRVCVENSG